MSKETQTPANNETANKANNTATAAKAQTPETVNAETEEVKVAKERAPRKTTDEKIADIRAAICAKFGATEAGLDRFLIKKLAGSGKRVNLMDLYEGLVLDIVLDKVDPKNLA